MKPVLFAVLLTLNDREYHGYEIMKEVKNRTGGTSILGPGSLYRVLSEMLQLGLIKRSDGDGVEQESSDDRRRYYGITEFGVRAAAAEVARMRSLVELAEAGKLATP